MMATVGRVRSRLTLERQIKDLECVYRLCQIPAEVEDDSLRQRAESASYGGWYIPMGRNGSGRRTEARHASWIHAAVDADARTVPLHLRQHAVRALHHLDLEEALVIEWLLMRGLRQCDIATRLKRSARQIQRLKYQALQRLALLLWDDDGHQTVPPVAKEQK